MNGFENLTLISLGLLIEVVAYPRYTSPDLSNFFFLLIL